MTTLVDTRRFFGWRVVSAVFVLAMFGWGVGFYGPPIYLHAVQQERGWPLALVSTAVTIHFLFGALVITTLPRLYRRFGVATVTKVGSIVLAIGVIGWASATQPWQLIAATLLSGGGWVTMGAAAVNAIIAPWFVRQRPAALSFAYNGASIGGVVFSPLWVAAIDALGFALASALIGLVMITAIWILTNLYYSREPQGMGLSADGGAPGLAAIPITAPSARPLPGSDLWWDLRFITLAAAMALGLFAQIGLLTHLFSLLLPALGTQLAGIATGAATAAAIAGRSVVGWSMPAAADRRLFGCASYLVQMLGSLALLLAAGDSIPLLALGVVVLFGAGIGNATSLPPLIAQAEFVRDDVMRVVPLIVAVAQASYAFAPAAFGLIRVSGPAFGSIGADAAPGVFIAAALLQCLAIGALLVGRRR